MELGVNNREVLFRANARNSMPNTQKWGRRIKIGLNPLSRRALQTWLSH
jgi:hypothetical protein